MVRLASFSVALVCAASALASNSLAARAEMHKKMVRVRDNAPPELPPTPIPSPTTAIVEDVAEEGKNVTGDVKRDNNFRFTFYEAGLGACGQTNVDSDYTVALNSQQFGSGENCFKPIMIYVNGQQTQATITDECPGCPYGGLDLTPGLFSFFGSLGLGVLQGSWSFV